MSRLIDEQWTSVSVHAPVLAFLKAEWDKWASVTRWIDRRLVSEARLDDPAANHLRACLLSALRGALLQRVPQDTEWFEVKYLRREHVDQLCVIGRCGWDDPRDHNELVQVAARRPQPLRQESAPWDAPLLWGHSRAGPFTILEGNNRLTAYVTSAQRAPPLCLPCYIGISAQACVLHLADAFVGA